MMTGLSFLGELCKVILQTKSSRGILNLAILVSSSSKKKKGNCKEEIRIVPKKRSLPGSVRGNEHCNRMLRGVEA